MRNHKSKMEQITIKADMPDDLRTMLESIARRQERIESKLDKLTSEKDSDMVDAEEAARITGYAKRTFYNLAGRRALRSYKVGGKLRFKVSDLMEWMESAPRRSAEELREEYAARTASRKRRN